jgi:hypothetical protein
MDEPEAKDETLKPAICPSCFKPTIAVWLPKGLCTACSREPEQEEDR